VNYVEEEETVRNDLTERYVQSGEFGSNYILGAGDTEICEE
jgi:mRNA (2'-O-methyladenosine-N6-)-methyltransferase